MSVTLSGADVAVTSGYRGLVATGSHTLAMSSQSVAGAASSSR
jgi:hypothetical protein